MNDYFIQRITVADDHPTNAYPFSIPAIRHINTVQFSQSVTFLVGENGSGKSTIIEALAVAAGFSAEGGTKNYSFSTEDTTSELAEHITLIRGTRRERYGFFLRAESFYTTANYAASGTATLGGPQPLLFDGTELHAQSHGEAFLAIVKSFRPGLFIFDEPESALSPQRILYLMSLIHELEQRGSQFIIATHSPILLAYPDAAIYELDQTGITQTTYDEIEHVALTRDFLSKPSVFIDKLFATQ